MADNAEGTAGQVPGDQGAPGTSGAPVQVDQVDGQAGPARKPRTGIARTYGEVASHFGVARDTVRNSWKAAGMPKLPCRWADLERWRETMRKRREDDPSVASANPIVTQAREKKIMADSMRAEAGAIVALHKAKLLQTDIVSLTLVERFLSEFLAGIRTNLLRLPGEVAAAYPLAWRETLAGDLRERFELLLSAWHGQASTLVDLKDEG